MRNLRPFGLLAFSGGVASAVSFACASEEAVTLSVDARDGGGNVLRVDAAADALDEMDASTPCTDAGMCIVPAPINTRINITSISGSGARDVWAVGSERTILHYDGSRWEKTSIPYEAGAFTMRSVWVGAADDVWIADGPAVRHSTGWKGSSGTDWESGVLGGAGAGAPTSISGRPGSIAFARQLTNFFTGAPIVLTAGWGDGGVLDPVYLKAHVGSSSATMGLWALAMTRPNELWATSFPTASSPAEPPPGSKVVRAHRVAPDGGDLDAEASWQVDEFDSRTDRNVYAVWGNEEVIWLAGEGGVLRRTTRERVWTRVFENVASPVGSDLRGLYGFATDDAWAVGDDATVLHWDGDTWTKLPTPLDAHENKPRLFAVWGSSPTDVWIGGNGVMLHFEGSAR